jgi:filamentous hemagglutinin
MEYIKAANEFVTHPPVGTLTIIQRDGDTVYYHPDKNWFAVKNKQGAPRTFFRPDPAIHGFETNLDYFKHQEYRP